MQIIDYKGHYPIFIHSYKNRKLDPNQRVKIYRNLNKSGVWYSILQNGLVVGHTQALMLVDALFQVQISGRDRAWRTKVRNVHAYVEGKIVPTAMGTDSIEGDLPLKVSYSLRKGFHTATGFPVKGADAVVLNKDGVKAAYVY